MEPMARMDRTLAIALACAALAAPPVLVPALAHCPSTPPTVELTNPAPGMAVQSACYGGPGGACVVDTFHVDSLRQQLVRRFADSRYAVFAYVDSVRHYQAYDTFYRRGELYYIDTLEAEDVQVRIHTYLKDTLPERRLKFTGYRLGLPGNPLATTFFPLLDTPFVAFFDAYDSLQHLGIGPMDGCFFEPAGFFIQEDRILKKGMPGDRMAGVSLPMEEFFAAVGIDPVPVPPVSLHRPARPSLRPGTGRPSPGSRRVDPNGRRIPAGGRAPGRTFPAP